MSHGRGCTRTGACPRLHSKAANAHLASHQALGRNQLVGQAGGFDSQVEERWHNKHNQGCNNRHGVEGWVSRAKRPHAHHTPCHAIMARQAANALDVVAPMKPNTVTTTGTRIPTANAIMMMHTFSRVWRTQLSNSGHAAAKESREVCGRQSAGSTASSALRT